MKRSEKFQELTEGVAELTLIAFIHAHFHMDFENREPGTFIRKCEPCEDFVDNHVPSHMLSRCVWEDENARIAASKEQIMGYMNEPLDE